MQPSVPAVDSEPADDDPAALRAGLCAARREADEYRDLLRQARADFATAHRRAETERVEQAAQARIDVLLRVLPILDELERCLSTVTGRTDSDEWLASIEATRCKLRTALESEGVERIDAVGALYNPWEHEAMQSQASPELEDQRILAVLREGYRIGDRVIRPAQVVVARQSG